MLKVELEARVKALESTLEKRVAELESTLKAIGSRFIRADGKKFVALPLTDEEDSYIREMLGDYISNCYGGDNLRWEDEYGTKGFENTLAESGTWQTGTLLPTFDGYHIYYTYSDSDGTQIEKVWGLKVAK